MKNSTVLCLGASIVAGQISTNFIDIVRKRPGNEKFRFINTGVAGYEAYNVLIHLDNFIKCQPDYVIILVGTNDVTADLFPAVARISRRTKKIPQPPSPQFYRENMLRIVNLLKKKTSAKIAVASLPILGEDLESPANKRIREYNLLINEICTNEQVNYLSVFEKQEEYLLSFQQKPGKAFEGGIALSLKLLIRHFLLRQSFDTISGKNGFLLLTDGIHMNSRGAEFIANEVEAFLRKNMNSI